MYSIDKYYQNALLLSNSLTFKIAEIGLMMNKAIKAEYPNFPILEDKAAINPSFIQPSMNTDSVNYSSENNENNVLIDITNDAIKRRKKSNEIQENDLLNEKEEEKQIISSIEEFNNSNQLQIQQTPDKEIAKEIEENKEKDIEVKESNQESECKEETDKCELKEATAILKDLKCPFIINQNKYSIFDRTIEKNGLKQTAVELGKGIICFSPLAQGLLTDRYLNGIPKDSRISTDGRFLQESDLNNKLAQIKALNELAQKRGQSLAQMALAWILKDEAITSVIIGASKPEQILDNVKAIENHSFTEEELKEIDNICMM